MSDISHTILRNLQYNEQYTRKVIPFLKKEYFESDEEKIFFLCIENFFNKYNSLPSKEIIQIQFENSKVKQDMLENLNELSNAFEEEKANPVQLDWLVDETEKFCKDRALNIALGEVLEIYSGDNQNLSRTAIPDILTKALSVSFDTDVGHDYIADAMKRFEYYNDDEARIPMFLDSFTYIMNGGTLKKTLNAFIAETGGGKSIMLCNLAANYIQNGHTVLYISMEMDEREISKRIDANLMDININKIDSISDEDWQDKVSALKTKLNLKENSLIVKQYPTSSAHTGHFKFLLQELKQKRGFVPTIIIVDYLNICASSRLKANVTSYQYIKSISEELRALAMEQDVVMWTALQFNTDGIANSDPEMTDVAESRGLVHTLDFLAALIVTEDLAAAGQAMVKQLKSRYGDKDKNKKFVIGLDKDKMRFTDLKGTGFSNSIQNSTVIQQKSTKKTKQVKGIKI